MRPSKYGFSTHLALGEGYCTDILVQVPLPGIYGPLKQVVSHGSSLMLVISRKTGFSAFCCMTIVDTMIYKIVLLFGLLILCSLYMYCRNA